jgi:ubiquinone/menaquinone biosynthesis C-methylase UbiE
VRGFEQIPFLYDPMCRLLEAAGLQRWRLWLVKGARGRVLEIGCGTGRNLPLYPAHARIIGIDPAMSPLHRAHRRAPGVPLVCARAEALPFKAGAFDTVVSGLVFCSVDDPARGLAEVRRVLAPGGALRMLEHVRSTSRFGGWFQDAIQPAWTWVAGGCRNNRDTVGTVNAAGFTIDEKSFRARGTMRRFEARACLNAHAAKLDKACSKAMESWDEKQEEALSKK